MLHVQNNIFTPLLFLRVYEFIKTHKNQQNVLGVDGNCCKGRERRENPFNKIFPPTERESV